MNKGHALYRNDIKGILSIKDIERLRGKRFLIRLWLWAILTCMP